MSLWVALVEGCEIKPRDAVLGVAGSLVLAMMQAQMHEEQVALGEMRPTSVLRWREDGRVWRAESGASSPLSELEYFVVPAESKL